MPHTKTNIKCSKCGQCIYTDEGFVPLPGLKGEHAPSCDHPKRPDQCKRYNPPPEFKKGVSIPTNEQMIKEKVGFHYDQG